MRLPTTLALLYAGLLGVSLGRSQDIDFPEPVDQPPTIEELLKRIPPDLPPEIRKQAEAKLREMLERRKQGGQPVGAPMGPFGRGGQLAFARLGATVESPSAALAEQLDLPKGQGLVLKEVTDASVASKGGLKSHDILLEVDGKAVPRDVAEFEKQLGTIKDDAAISVTVLRKGKTETLKEVKLPKAAANARLPGFGEFPGFPGGGFPGFPGGGPMPPMIPQPGDVPGFGPMSGNGVITTIFRTADRFTARHQEGSLIITLTGAENKAKEIKVQDGRESNTYDSPEKVPIAYRDKVKNLSEIVEKSSIKVEIKGKD